METANFYWTVIVGIAAATWIVVQFIRDRIALSVGRTKAAVSHLIEIDRLIIENPASQRYLSETARESEAYFRAPDRLKDDLFYQAKTLVYMHLNTYDEILSLSDRNHGLSSLLGPGALIEAADWEQYIQVKLRHPLYRSILNNEEGIFGESLRQYWRNHKAAVETAVSDPFMW